jgi:hypothetical protein
MVEVVVATIVSLLVVSVGTNIGFLTSSSVSQQSDQDQLQKIADTASTVCSLGISTDQTAEFEFSSFESVRADASAKRLEAETGSSTTEVELPDGCDYTLSGWPMRADDSAKWEVNASTGLDTDVGTVKLEATAK